MYLIHFRRDDEADQFLARTPLDVLPFLKRESKEGAEGFFLRIERIRTLSEHREASCRAS